MTKAVGSVPRAPRSPELAHARNGAATGRELSDDTRPTWIALTVFVVLIAVHATNRFGDVVYSIITLGAVGCAFVGVRRHRLELRWPWWSLMATSVLWTIASALSEMTGSLGDLSPNRSLLPDLFALPGYALFGLALAGFLRARRASSERAALLDGVMLAVGASLLVHELLIAPTLGDDQTWFMARLVVVAYPAASMCLLAIAGRLAFGSGERSVAFTMLLLGTMSLFVGDVIFAYGEVGRLRIPEALLEVPYLLVPAFIGTAVLHPSIRLLDQPSDEPVRRLGPARLAAVSGALLAPILVIAFHDEANGRIVAVVLCTVLAVGAIARIGGAMRAQAAFEAQLFHRATHDELTGLPSRVAVVSHAEGLLARRDAAPVAVLFLDLDQFKLVNDSMGHTVGDQLLELVADRILSSVRADDMVGRISGDEFVIVAAGLDGDAAQAMADRIRAALRAPFELSQGEVFVSASVGVTIADGSRRTHAATLIQEADTAMYRSKDAGRNTVTIFDSSMRERIERRIELERLLRHALDAGDVAAWFQPIVRVSDGMPCGLEALARWEVDGRMISPAEFIPVAEESGLIVPLGAHVLDEACRQLAWWRRTVPAAAGLYVSVNLSPRQVWASDIVDTVAAALQRHELPGEALWLEITENVMMEDSVTTTAVLSALRSLGVRLAVDDFGTGFSSLSYLKRFPVSRVKIDRSFVSGLGTHDADTSLVEAVVAMSTALGLEPIAEGVETQHQADRLAELGCTQAQGYLYSPAVPATELPDLLHSLRPNAKAVRQRRCLPVAGRS